MANIKQKKDNFRIVLIHFALVIFGIILCLLILELSLNFLNILIRYKDTKLKVSSARNSYNIVCIGDSYTYGVGVERHYAYPSQLQQILEKKYPERKFNVINLGMPGWNSSQMLSIFPKNLDKYAPQCLIICAGANNCWNIEDSNYFLFVNRIDYHVILKRLDFYFSKLRTYKLLKICKMNLMNKFKDKKLKVSEGKTEMSQEEYRFLELAETDIINGKDKSAVLEKLKMAYKYNQDYKRAIRLFKIYYPWQEFSEMVVSFFRAIGNDKELKKIQQEKSYRCLIEPSGFLNFNIAYESYNTIIFDKLLKYDLGRMIEIARDRGIKLILLTYVSDYIERGSDNNIIRWLAQKYNIPCVDIVSTFDELIKKYSFSDYLLPDGHFTNKGGKVVAEAVYEKFISEVYR